MVSNNSEHGCENRIVDLLRRGSEVCLDYLGYKPEVTRIRLLDDLDDLKSILSTPHEFSGIFNIRNRTAYLRNSNPITIFHEYFGHGLYSEQTRIGRLLYSLEQKLLDEENQQLPDDVDIKTLMEFRNSNPIFNQLRNLMNEDLSRGESFAIWSEYLLSRKLNCGTDDFNRRFDSFNANVRDVIGKIIEYSNNVGPLSTYYSFGLARRTNIDTAKRLIKEKYKHDLANIKFALLYGSRAEFSDVDVFFVGEGIPDSSDFLDTRIMSQKELNRSVENLDICATIPLHEGEFIFGDYDYYHDMKRKTHDTPITQDAIRHNYLRSLEQQEYCLDSELSDRTRAKCRTYAQTFANASHSLSRGLRIFNKDKLLSYSDGTLVESDIPLYMKGDE